MLATLPVGYLDVKGTGGYLSLSRRQVWRLVERGALRPIRLPGCRKVLFRRTDIDALCERHTDA